MPSSLRPEEEWARQLVSAALGVPVRQHDDGSSSRMHDLEVLFNDGRVAAVEVTAAADGESIALWRLVNGGGRWIESNLAGAWMVSVEPTARAKRLRGELPALLGMLERLRVTHLWVADMPPNQTLSRHAQALGITDAHQSETDFPGSIYVTIELPHERSGGMVADNADAAAHWVGAFLQAEAQADVRAKLGQSGADEHHAFVVVPGFATVPFSVADPLMRDDVRLPEIDPTLPGEISHVWIVSTWNNGRGLRWSPQVGWSFFAKRAD